MNIQMKQQQLQGVQKYNLNFKEFKRTNSKKSNEIAILDENIYDYNATGSKILNTQTNNDMVNSLVEQADLQIKHLMTNGNEVTGSLVKTTSGGDEVSMFKVTELNSNGLQASNVLAASNVTVSQNQLIAMNKIKNPLKTPREYLLTEI